MHRSKELDRPSSSPQEEKEEDVFKTPLKSKKRRSHITPKRSIKKERFSAKRQLDPVILGQVTMNKLLSNYFTIQNIPLATRVFYRCIKLPRKLQKRSS